MFFWNCHCGKGALCFCFDLARVFLQGATMPPLHPFLDLSLLWEGDRYSPGHYASASTYLGYFFRMPTCHPYTLYFLDLSLMWERDKYSPATICFDLARVFLQGATMPSLHPRKVETILDPWVPKRIEQQLWKQEIRQ